MCITIREPDDKDHRACLLSSRSHCTRIGCFGLRSHPQSFLIQTCLFVSTRDGDPCQAAPEADTTEQCGMASHTRQTHSMALAGKCQTTLEFIHYPTSAHAIQFWMGHTLPGGKRRLPIGCIRWPWSKESGSGSGCQMQTLSTSASPSL